MHESNPIELASSDKKSRAYFRHKRWSGKRQCPRCKYRLLYYLPSHRYACKHCKYNFGEFTGTLSRIKNTSKSCCASFILVYSRGTSIQIRFYVQINLATIERTFRIFRQAIYDTSLHELNVLKLSGMIEVDEALFGGHRRGKRGWGSEGKSLVFGIYQRNGKVITFPISEKHDTLIPLIKQHTKKGFLYYTDDYTAYAALNLMGKHHIIAHGGDEYVREDTTHINGIEGFWSYVKVWLFHYRGVPKQYFHLYLKEIEFRFNNRQTAVYQMVANMITKTAPTV